MARSTAASSPSGLDRPLERRERDPRVASGACGQELEGLLRDLGRIGDAAFGIGERAAKQLADVLGHQRAELVQLHPAEQRGVHLEVGVLRRRPDQRHEPVLDSREQRVLLRLVEAVDLVEEEDRRLAGRAAAF